jgi:DNA-binding NarL/FixJ family response regulator
MISQDSRSLKVLLVDDHHIVREGLRTIITRAGIEVSAKSVLWRR